MRVCVVTDKEGSAIDRLCRMTEERNPQVRFDHFAIHPKRPEPERVAAFLKAAKEADVINYAYWKTAVTLRRTYPELEKLKAKTVLESHNEHNIEGDQEWADLHFDLHVCKNEWQRARLKERGVEALLIRHAYDHAAYQMREAPPQNDSPIVGYVGQFKKCKGLMALAEACHGLGYQLRCVGRVSEAGYWAEVKEKYGDTVREYQNVSDAELSELYGTFDAYCCNSGDGTESGTMPILEAMAKGVPVVTREVGLVRDCGRDGQNMVVRTGERDDVDDLKAALRRSVEMTTEERSDMVWAAWRTATRSYHPDVQARRMYMAWRGLTSAGRTTVTAVVPTCGRAESLALVLEGLAGQTYRDGAPGALDVVVVNDGEPGDATGRVVAEAMELYGLPISYLETGSGPDDYGLAKARNMGIVEATGEILMLVDDRLVPHERAARELQLCLEGAEKFHGRKLFAYGSKGATKGFVENFSACWRRELILAGMMCERMDGYGGMTQELSKRLAHQGWRFESRPDALAEPTAGTHSRSRHRESIVRMKLRLMKMHE